jgi:hypothetical protein
MPQPSPLLKRRLTKLGTQLSQEWTACKEEYQSFRDYLRVRDSRGILAKKFARPWAFTRDEAVAAVAEAKLQPSPTELSQLMTAWSESVAALTDRWDDICEYEEEIDRLVARAYGIPKANYKELVERAPSCALDDVLLPQ